MLVCANIDGKVHFPAECACLCVNDCVRARDPVCVTQLAWVYL